MKIQVDSVAWFPKKAVNLAELKHTLTVDYFKMGEKESIAVPAYETQGKYILVPRDYGLHLIAKLGYTADIWMSDGERMKFPKDIKHTGDYAYQQEVVDSILRLSKTLHDFILEAMTGKGKTVMALSAIQKLGRSALIVVDQENLMNQWVDQCKSLLGLREDQIGIIQGDRCDYHGKHVTIAMVHSLVQREYAEAMYPYFGVVVFDEVHGLGAPTFSAALRMFPASLRFGVSATVDRADALQRILHWNLGNVEIELTDKHEASYVYYLESDTTYSWYANISPKSGRILAEISEDGVRNCLVAEAIAWMYREGRDVLIIGDRIEQLEALRAMVYYLGVPEEDAALYSGMRNVWEYSKNPTPARRPYGYVKGTDYTPVILAPKRKKIPRAELQKSKAEARLIYATYGMFSKGVDVPRLTGGIDCTPRAKAAQTHGRILRKQEGKLVPIWVTIRDINSYRLEYQFLKRIEDYVADSAEIYKWRMDKGVRLVDVKELKRNLRQAVKELKEMNIITLDDGNYMLQTAPTQIGRSSLPAIRTEKTTPCRRANSREDY